MHDERTQLLPGGSEMVLTGTRVSFRFANDNAVIDQQLEPLGHDRWRDQRHTASQFIEVTAAHQELANEQQGPPLSEQFERLGYRTILAVSNHGCAPVRTDTPSISLQQTSVGTLPQTINY